MENKYELRKLSMRYYRFGLVAVITTLFGIGAAAAGTLAGYIMGGISLVAVIVLLVLRSKTKAKFKGEFEKSLSNVVKAYLKDNIKTNIGFRVKARGKRLKYFVDVYDLLESYAKEELKAKIKLLIEVSNMNVKVKLRQKTLNDLIREIFS